MALNVLLHNRRAQLLLLNSLTFGLEVCLAAGITYVPPLLLEVGVEEKFMTMVLGRQFLLYPCGVCFSFGGWMRACKCVCVCVLGGAVCRTAVILGQPRV